MSDRLGAPHVHGDAEAAGRSDGLTTPGDARALGGPADAVRPPKAGRRRTPDPLAEAKALVADGSPSDRAATAAAFGRRVAQYREARGYSQEELATRCGLSQSGLSLVEEGRRAPSIETARVIAWGLGVSVGALMGEVVAQAVGDDERLLADWRRASAKARETVWRFLRFCLDEEASGPPGGRR